MIFFTSFPQNIPRPKASISSPAFGTIQKVQSTRRCRLCPAQGSAPAWGGRRVFGHCSTRQRARLNPAAKAPSRTTALLLPQPPGFEAELFFQSHMIRSSEIPKYKDCWACIGPMLLFVLFFPKGPLKDEQCKPGLDGVLWQSSAQPFSERW